MIILDTNVISELMKYAPDSHAIAWVDQQDIATLFVTTITLDEIRYGLHALPDGKRKNYLETAFDSAVLEVFKYSVLAFDNASSIFYGQLMGKRKKLGQPLSVLDGQIAAIARANQMQLATRNIKDFQNCDLNLVNPFESKLGS